jgi:hypothetical protein
MGVASRTFSSVEVSVSGIVWSPWPNVSESRLKDVAVVPLTGWPSIYHLLGKQ